VRCLLNAELRQYVPFLRVLNDLWCNAAYHKTVGLIIFLTLLKQPAFYTKLTSYSSKYSI
jgi:hypothetical protein